MRKNDTLEPGRTHKHCDFFHLAFFFFEFRVCEFQSFYSHSCENKKSYVF